MKKKDLQSLKEKSVPELRKKLEDLKKKQLELKAKLAVNRESNLKAAQKVRREIAQVLTLINQKGEEK